MLCGRRRQEPFRDGATPAGPRRERTDPTQRRLLDHAAPVHQPDGQVCHVAYVDEVALLVLLNGPPASGKSTLATRLVRTRPMAPNLDIDLIRGQLGAWTDSLADAGVAARRLAVAMTATTLPTGMT